MQVWTEAWHHASAEELKEVYSTEAVIFPPNKNTVKGNDSIVEFMSGGLGKVDVYFESESLILSDSLAFEYGVFRDVALNSGDILGIGKYSITWGLEKGQWKILCHTWSMPVN